MKQRFAKIIEIFRLRIHGPSRFHAYRTALRSQRGLAKIRVYWRIVQHECMLVIRWWRTNDQHYRWRWRTANGVLAFLIFFGIALPITQQVLLNQRYQLSADTVRLVGATDHRLQSQLRYSDGNYQFNQAALQQTGSMRTQAGTPTGKNGDTSTYALTVAQDFAKGTTYSDVNTGQSFQLVPQFNGNPVKEVQGHLVIPIDNAQAIYTLKGNGLKEDVVVPRATQDTMSFSYTLKLPSTLQAKVIPGSSGAIGIYSADPTLYGNISTSSSTDKATLQKARENGEKNNLVFGIPRPTIKTLGGTLPDATTARFEFQNNTLTVIATGLTKIKGAFTIDPSVVVTSASDFQTGGNNEGMIAFDATNNQISRGGLTGGSLATSGWNTTTSFTTVRFGLASVVNNGYLYVMGGYGSSGYLNDVQYAPINTDGTIGTWNTTTSFTTARSGMTSVAYNGYLYVIGGSYFNDVQYAPINTDGTIGTWNTTTSFTTGRYEFGSVAYNGYLYVMGGYSGTGYLNDVQYAPINANGTIGTWSTTTSFTTARFDFGSVAYNGYLYVMGGNDGSSYYNDVQYAPINANGTIGTWKTTTSFTNVRAGLSSAIYNGYLYVIGGLGGSYYNDVQYAPINANGTIGTWNTTASFTNGRYDFGSVAYNGYLYVMGGHSGTAYNDVQSVRINPPGTPTSFTSATNLPSTYSVTNSCTVVANGYIYEIGGSHSGAAQSTVYYAGINNDASLTSWVTTTALPAALYSVGCAYANGYVYVVGGYNGTTAATTVYYGAVSGTGTIPSWSSYTGTANGSLPASVYNAGVVIVNNYLYVIGGSGGNTSAVNFAQLNTSTGALITNVASCPSSGTLSHAAWCSTNSLPNGRIDMNAVTANNYIYVVGGYNAGATATTYYAVVNSNGTLGTWQTSTQNLPTAVYWASTVVAGGTMYVIGGYTGTTAVATVYYATITSTGEISAWQTGPSLAAGQYEATAAVSNGTIYSIGGFTSAPQYTVYSASINNGGSGALGTWGATTSFTTQRSDFGTAVYNGYMYISGGKNSSSTLGDVQYAPINADGTTGTWQTTTSFTGGIRYGHRMLAYNGYMYVLGGHGASAMQADVEYAPINSDGTIGTWQTTTSFTTIRAEFGAAVYKGYMYIMGGDQDGTNYLNDVQYAPINSNGTVGTWTATNSFATIRRYISAVAYNGHLYVIGGNGGTFLSAQYYNDIQMATINSNGTIGAWQTIGTISGQHYSFGLTAYDGYMYSLGGHDSSGYLNDVQYAPINTDGTLGALTKGTSLGTARSELGAVAANGTIYTLGGLSSGGYQNDVQYAPLNAIARIGRYSKLVNFSSATNITGFTYNGTVPGGNAAVTYQVAGANGVFGSSANTASISGNGSCNGNAKGAYYMRVSVIFDDSYGIGTGGSFPDSFGNANLTDFTINYNAVHPAPSVRLRLGQTLQAGLLSAFDTCT